MQRREHMAQERAHWNAVAAVEETARISARKRRRDDPWFEGWSEGRRFGIALSGGGIRSATLGLGFLTVLNRARVLQTADYLSSVSGGGYIAAHLQAALYEAAS